MSMYGISRLLKSRDLGPAQLLPAIESFRDEAQAHGTSVGPMFEGLRDATSERDALRPAVDALEAVGRSVVAGIQQLFGGPLKLGARRRLAMEREAERLGAELEALRGLADVLLAALRARPVYVTLDDLLHGRWQSPPTFVRRRVHVVLGQGASLGLVVEPRVVRAFLEHSFSCFASEGITHLLVHAREVGGATEIEVRPRSNGSTGDPIEVRLAASLPAADEVLASVARHVELGFEREGSRWLLTLPP